MLLLELTRTAHRRPPPFSQVLSLVTHRNHGAEPRATKTTPSKALRTPNCAPSWLGRFARATRLHPIISPALPNHILKCLSCATDDFSRQPTRLFHTQCTSWQDIGIFAFSVCFGLCLWRFLLFIITVVFVIITNPFKRGIIVLGFEIIEYPTLK